MRQNALVANDFDPERIRCSPNTRVVIFTLDDAQELRQKAFDLGASACVTNSAPMEELLAKVSKLAATSLTMTGSESQRAATGLASGARPFAPDAAGTWAHQDPAERAWIPGSPVERDASPE